MELTAIAYWFIFAFGACLGSFLNVLIYRLPAGISLWHPPSRCPHCLHSLGKTENIPVFGWLWLRGRCRWCQAPISFRYPLLEAITGLLFVLTARQFGFSWLTLGYWVSLGWLLPLALIDLDTMILPNSLTQSGLVIGLGFQSWLGYWRGNLPGSASYLFMGILSAVLGIWLFDTILMVGTLVFGKPAMGGGDPKLAAMIAAWLGWQNLLLTAFLACAIGSIVGVGAIAFGWLQKGQPIPFGPFLVLGAILTIFFGDSLLSMYWKFVLLSSSLN
jgi:leader peptidase (prepilin peptidase)/N-methyltransferase